MVLYCSLSVNVNWIHWTTNPSPDYASNNTVDAEDLCSIGCNPLTRLRPPSPFAPFQKILTNLRGLWRLSSTLRLQDGCQRSREDLNFKTLNYWEKRVPPQPADYPGVSGSTGWKNGGWEHGRSKFRTKGSVASNVLGSCGQPVWRVRPLGLWVRA